MSNQRGRGFPRNVFIERAKNFNDDRKSRDCCPVAEKIDRSSIISPSTANDHPKSIFSCVRRTDLQFFLLLPSPREIQRLTARRRVLAFRDRDLATSPAVKNDRFRASDLIYIYDRAFTRERALSGPRGRPGERAKTRSRKRHVEDDDERQTCGERRGGGGGGGAPTGAIRVLHTKRTPLRYRAGASVGANERIFNRDVLHTPVYIRPVGDKALSRMRAYV